MSTASTMVGQRCSDETETDDGEVTSDRDGTNRLLATLPTYLRCRLNELGVATSLATAMATQWVEHIDAAVFHP